MQSDLVLLASIINNKVAFRKLDDSSSGGSGGSQTDDLSLVELPGYTPGKQHH